MNKVKKMCMILLVILALTGCGNIDEYLDGYSVAVVQRVNFNINLVEKLYASGVLTKSVRDTMITGITSNLARFGVNRESIKENIGEDGIVSSENISSEGADKILDGISPNIVYFNSEDSKLKKYLVQVERPKVGGVEILATDSKNTEYQTGSAYMSNLGNYRIYVLKKAPKKSNSDSDYNTYIDLNEILGKTDTTQISNGNIDTETNEILEGMFIDSGRGLIDPVDEDNALIKDTVSPDKYTAKYFKDTFAKYSASSIPSPPNILGKDLVFIKVESKTEKGSSIEKQRVATALQVRLHEINETAVNKITGKEGVIKDLYLIHNNKCYLMEYPVFYVSGFETTDGVNFKPQYTMSDLQVNILNGNVYFRDGSLASGVGGSATSSRYLGINKAGGSSFVLDGVSRYGIKGGNGYDTSCIDTTSKTQSEAYSKGYTSYYSNYITNYGVPLYSEEAKQSSIAEVKSNAIEAEKIYNKNLNEYGSIVLRDYLEYTYMPDVVSGESIVALGRMLRLTSFSGQVTDNNAGIIGEFISKLGVPYSSLNKTSESDIVSSSTISVRDVMAIKPTEDGKGYKLGFKAYNPSLYSNSTDIGSADETITNNTDNKEVSIFDKKSKDLKYSYVTHLGYTYQGNTEYSYISTRFPGIHIAKSDLASLSKVVGSNSGNGVTTNNTQVIPVMYGMLLDLSPYTSGLYNSWINGDSDGNYGSLEWWNSWLTGTGYLYQIDDTKVKDSINGVYNFDVTDSGYLILDLDRISKIQSIYDTEDKSYMITLWVTINIIVGILCIVYSALLPLAWIYDTNITIGPRILQLITLGKWYAIQTDYISNERVFVDSKKARTMTLSKILINSFSVLVFGLTLCYLDPLSILKLLVELASKLTSLFNGIL